MSWTDLSASFGYAATLAGSEMQALRDNLFAISSGYPNAPRIRANALFQRSVLITNLSSEYQGKLVTNGTSHDHTNVKIPNGGIESGSIYSALMNTAVGSSYIQTVTNGGAYVFPRGIFNVSVDTACFCQFQMDTGSEWLGFHGDQTYMSNHVYGGMVVGDGATTRFTNSSGATRTLYIQVLI